MVTDHRFLGGFIGGRSERDEYVMSNIHRWMGHIVALSDTSLS